MPGKGILVPAHVDERTGRRFYDIQQSTKLDMILQLQQMGFSLNEIAELNEGQSMEQLHKAAIARLAAIDEQQRELALSRRLAEQLVSGCEVFFNQPILDQITVSRQPCSLSPANKASAQPAPRARSRGYFGKFSRLIVNSALLYPALRINLTCVLIKRLSPALLRKPTNPP